MRSYAVALKGPCFVCRFSRVVAVGSSTLVGARSFCVVLIDVRDNILNNNIGNILSQRCRGRDGLLLFDR